MHYVSEYSYFMRTRGEHHWYVKLLNNVWWIIFKCSAEDKNKFKRGKCFCAKIRSIGVDYSIGVDTKFLYKNYKNSEIIFLNFFLYIFSTNQY